VISQQPHFSPKQVAIALGVSESTIKRWCDQDRIPTFRTEGGHRRIALECLCQFIRQSGQCLAHPDAIGLPRLDAHREMHIPGADQPLQQEFRNALIAGCETKCRQIVCLGLEHGLSATAVVETLMTDAMQAVGQAWECHQLNPYQERRACEICMRIIRYLVDRLPSIGEEAPVAIGGAPAGDPYQLPSALVELALCELGWRATNLGNDLPMDCLFQAVHDCRPQVVWLSVSVIPDAEQFIFQHNRFAESLPDGIALFVGGRALTDAIRPRLKYTAYCDRLAHLVELARMFPAFTPQLARTQAS